MSRPMSRVTAILLTFNKPPTTKGNIMHKNEMKSTPKHRRARMVGAGLAVALGTAIGVPLIAGAGPAFANGCLSNPQACVPKPPSPPPPPPPASITSVVPDQGWAGDTVTIHGISLQGATSVTFAGLAATYSDNGTITTTVPAGVPTGLSGPEVMPVVVVTPNGTARATFTWSTALQTTVDNSWIGGSAGGEPAGWNQGSGANTAETTVTVDRISGMVNEQTTVDNSDYIESFAVSVSTLYADSSGKLIGYSTPYGVTAPVSFPFTCDGTTPTCVGTGSESTTVQPLHVASSIHQIQVVQVYDSTASLQSTLSTLLSDGATVAKVLSVLAPLMS